MSLKTKLLIFAAVLAVFGTIVLYVLEFQWFQNYFGAKRLVMGALAAGLVLGLAIGFLFRKKADEQGEKMQLWATCITLPLLLMPLLASLTNRLFAQQSRLTPVEFWEEKAYTMNRYGQLKDQRPDTSGYYVFVVMDGEMIRLESDEPVFPTAQKGDTVLLPVRKGLFGVAFVNW
jgi:hypothetical protein